MARPRENGSVVAPSGRFPLLRSRPTGSNVADTPAAASARGIRALTSLWRAWRLVPCRHDRAWSPKASNLSPQTQIEQVATCAPSLSPTATDRAASGRRGPSFEEGRHRNTKADSSVAWILPESASAPRLEAKHKKKFLRSEPCRPTAAMHSLLWRALRWA